MLVVSKNIAPEVVGRKSGFRNAIAKLDKCTIMDLRFFDVCKYQLVSYSQMLSRTLLERVLKFEILALGRQQFILIELENGLNIFSVCST